MSSKLSPSLCEFHPEMRELRWQRCDGGHLQVEGVGVGIMCQMTDALFFPGETLTRSSNMIVDSNKHQYTLMDQVNN